MHLVEIPFILYKMVPTHYHKNKSDFELSTAFIAIQ